MSKTFGFGVIGMGSIAPFHIRSIQEIPNCELRAVASSNEERARKAGTEYSVPHYTDYEALIQREDIDIICICTASGSHLEPTLIAAREGKHVITEKPLEVTLARANQMIAACEAAGVSLNCIFQNRYKPEYQTIKEAVDSGKLGKLVLGNAYIKWYRTDEYYASRGWRGTLAGDGGAALINQSIHTIDLLQDLMGPVKSVFGKTLTRTHDIEGEDLGLAMLEFKNGAMGTIEGSTSIYPGYPERLEIHGENGGIVYEGGKIVSWNIKGDKAEDYISTGTGESGGADPMAINYEAHKMQIAETVEAIQQKKTSKITGKEGRKSLEIIQAIYTSSKQKKEILL